MSAPAADRGVDVLQALGVLLALVEEGDALRVVRAAADVGQLDDVDPAAAVLVVELHDVLVPGGNAETDHVWRERAEVVLTRHQLASL